MNGHATIYLIDHDKPTQNSICAFVDRAGLRYAAFDTGIEFLKMYKPTQCGCILLEARLPDMSGLQLQNRLATGGSETPVIFVTAHGSIPLAVRAMRAGALSFFEKPFREDELWEAIQEAITIDRERCDVRMRDLHLKERMGQLSMREERVLTAIADGKTKQEIAVDLNVSIRTVELSRARLIKKLGLRSPLELLRFASAASDGRRGPTLDAERRLSRV
jgi:FixJ family two-component response regulator